jgi:hypothetical protein
MSYKEHLMRKAAMLICLRFLYVCLYSQTPVGTWSDHLIYDRAEKLALGSKEVYASTGSSLLVYNREFDELRKLSRINGLTETGISTIAWSEEYNTLVIGYLSTNLDLVSDKSIYNVPDMTNKYIPGKKEINRIRTNGKYAYLACSFGIVIIDLQREKYMILEPGDSYRTAEVWDISFGNGNVYAATDMGLFYANIHRRDCHIQGNVVRKETADPDGNYNSVLFSGTRLYVNRSGENFEGDSYML